jgi:nucleotide-binding universal stress UspA family protein
VRTDSKPTLAALDAKAASPLSLRGRPILVATDGSRQATAAVRVAAALADARGALPEVLQVFDSRVFAPPSPLPGLIALTDDLLGETPHEGQKRELRVAIDELLGSPRDWPIHVRIGTPAGAIVREAERAGAALIVVGLRHHGTVDRVLRDETTLHVARAAHVPVLGVAPTLVGLPGRVVVGVDFSRASVRAARAALTLLADGGTLVLAYARPPIDVTSEADEGAETIQAQGVPAAFDRLRAELLAGDHLPPGVAIEPVVLPGDPAAELRALAERSGADLIAVGSHRHETVERWLLGSVTTELVRDGRVSVLVVPPVSSRA